MEITRSAIHSFATHCSKLTPVVSGAAKPWLNNILQYRPNAFMDTSKFIYRVATILSVDTTAFIVPIFDDYFSRVVGIYPLPPSSCELVEDTDGSLWIRYTFSTGKRVAVRYEDVGVLTTHQYNDEFFGSGNGCMKPTIQLVDLQNQGVQDAIKSSASIRFLARLENVVRPDDLEKERKEFVKMNLSKSNDSGVLIVDNKYSEVKQLISKPYVCDSSQMNVIQTNVYNYFGTNEAILQNSFDESQWNAYYEGKIEPFALQLSLVLTNMLFTDREITAGNAVTFTSNRMQYASNQTKLDVSTQMFDRGLLRVDDVMDIWNLPRLGGDAGNARYIRLEYTNIGDSGVVTPNEPNYQEPVQTQEPAARSKDTTQKPKAVIVHGAPCSGKSTYVRAHIGENDVEYDYDRLLEAMTDRTTHSTKQHAGHNITVKMRSFIINRAKDEPAVSKTWIIARDYNDYLKEILDGFEVEDVQIRATEEECLANLAGDDSRPDKKAWEDVIHAYFQEGGKL